MDSEPLERFCVLLGTRTCKFGQSPQEEPRLQGERPRIAVIHSSSASHLVSSERCAGLCRVAASMGYNWAKFEAWRKHPMLTNNLRLRHSLPGLGLATAAFGIFVAYDKLVAGNSGGHH